MISLLGVVAGLLTLFIPTLFWPRNVPRLSGPAFMQKYPDKKWVNFLHAGLPFVWVLLYGLVVFPFLWRIGDPHLYLVSFTIGSGLATAHGIIEIQTSVSIRNFSRGGKSTYLVDKSVRRLGWIRIGFVFVGGSVTLPLLYL